VLNKRSKLKNLNMFIWKELRLHALLFAMRGIMIILFPSASKFIVFLTLYLADYITSIYGISGYSTVRGKQERVGSRSIFNEINGIFFSSSQLGAKFLKNWCF